MRLRRKVNPVVRTLRFGVGCLGGLARVRPLCILGPRYVAFERGLLLNSVGVAAALAAHLRCDWQRLTIFGVFIHTPKPCNSQTMRVSTSRVPELSR